MGCQAVEGQEGLSTQNLKQVEADCRRGFRPLRRDRTLGISPRKLQRLGEDEEVKAEGRQEAVQQREPANKLSEHECNRILTIAN